MDRAFCGYVVRSVQPVATITYEIPSTETIKLSGNFSHSGLPHQTRAGARTVRTNIKGSIGSTAEPLVWYINFIATIFPLVLSSFLFLYRLIISRSRGFIFGFHTTKMFVNIYLTKSLSLFFPKKNPYF